MLTEQQQVVPTASQDIHQQSMEQQQQAAPLQPATLPCFMVNSLTANSEEQCKFMIDNDCLEDESTIDYVYLVYCDISHELRYASIVLILSLVIVLFLNLSAVADEFLCPSLLTVAKNLRMSDSLAGVTLLAFGNGCPDIFSSLAAASSGRPEIIVGELLGAGIFCTSIVAGLIFIHNDFKLARRPLLRDATFYLLAVYLIWLYCYQGEVTFYGALAFIIIYVIYLFVALSGQAIHSRLRGEYPLEEATRCQDETLKDQQLAPAAGPHDDGELHNWLKWREEALRRGSLVKWSAQVGASEKSSLVLSDDKMSIRISYENPGKLISTVSDGQYDKRKKSVEGQPATVVAQAHQAGGLDLMGDHEGAPTVGRQSNEHDLLNELSLSTFHKCQINAINISNSKNVILDDSRAEDGNKFTLDEFQEFLSQINPIGSSDWAEAKLFGKLILVLRAPLLCATLVTVPVVSSEKTNNNWNRLLNSIHCFTIPIAIVYLTRLGSLGADGGGGGDDDDLLSHRSGNADTHSPSASPIVSSSPYLAGLVPLKFMLILPFIALALFVFCATNRHKAPKYHAIYSYFGFAMSVLWIYSLATEIISILKTVGIIFSMTDTAIGLGVLAWGNSLGDIVANLTLAEAGYARMALGASIGAPLLNLLLGFGLSFTISLKPGDSQRIKYTHTTTLLAITLALVLILLILSTLAPGNRSKRPFGYLLISCYGVYFALAVCLECGIINF